MATATQSRSAGSAAAQANPSDFLSAIKKSGSGLPSRIVIHGVEGIGKTSMPAHAANPIFLMSRGETGLETLIDSGRLPETDHFPEVTDWTYALNCIKSLQEGDHDRKTLIIDTLNGLERQCHEHVCQRDYGGNWGKNGFSSYQQGYDVSLADWRLLLSELDKLRETRRMAIFCLVHTKVSPFRNPEGADYDRYAPDMHHKTWSLTHKWADMVLFANFYTHTDESGARAKATGGRERVLYTERHAAYDAKNRHGLPSEISMGNSGAEAWNNLREAVTAAKGGGSE